MYIDKRIQVYLHAINHNTTGYEEYAVEDDFVNSCFNKEFEHHCIECSNNCHEKNEVITEILRIMREGE